MRFAAAIPMLLASVWSLPALADVAPPDVAACFGKSLGQACTIETTGGTGTCQDSTCTRASPTGPVNYACVKCLPPGASGADAGPTPAPGTDAGPTAPPEPEAEESGGCSVLGASPTARELGALAFAGSFALIFFVRRRRKGP